VPEGRLLGINFYFEYAPIISNIDIKFDVLGNPEGIANPIDDKSFDNLDEDTTAVNLQFMRTISRKYTYSPLGSYISSYILKDNMVVNTPKLKQIPKAYSTYIEAIPAFKFGQ
jgi:hypothetical protein